MRLRTCLSKHLLAVAHKDLAENEVRKKGVALRNSTLVGQGEEVAGAGSSCVSDAPLSFPLAFPSLPSFSRGRG